MPTLNIRITAYDTGTGKLTLDYPHARAQAGDSIHWFINSGLGIAITSIAKKSGSDEIWQTPPRMQGNHWVGKIKSTADETQFYVYNIVWTKDGGTYTHDPLISIRPSDLHHILKFIVSAVPGLVIGLLASLIYWRQTKTEQKRLRDENERLKNNIKELKK